MFFFTHGEGRGDFQAASMVLRLLTTSVLIVGGGVSGLVTAHRLAVSRPAVEVLVAEGASRPGGVMRSDQ